MGERERAREKRERERERARLSMGIFRYNATAVDLNRNLQPPLPPPISLSCLHFAVFLEDRKGKSGWGFYGAQVGYRISSGRVIRRRHIRHKHTLHVANDNAY